MNKILVFLKTGGIIMFPLSFLAITLLTIIIDKIFFYYKYLKITKNIENLVYQPQFCLDTWQNSLQKFSTNHFYYALWHLIRQNTNIYQNNTLLENQANSLLKKIEKQMFSGVRRRKKRARGIRGVPQEFCSSRAEIRSKSLKYQLVTPSAEA